MIFSLLEDNRNIYISIHTEIAFSNGIEPNIANDSYDKQFRRKGIFENYLELNIFEKIIRNITSKEYSGKRIFLDFQRVYLLPADIKPNDWRSVFIKLLFDAKKKDSEILLINICTNIYNTLESLIQTSIQDVNKNTSNIFFYKSFGSGPNYYGNEEVNHFSFSFEHRIRDQELDLLFEIETIKNRLIFQDIREQVKNTCFPFNKEVLTSSKILKLSHYIDIKQIIENKKEFFFFSYLLAEDIIDKLIVKKQENSASNPILFFQSMNGGSLASCLSKLLNLDLFFVDHLGPNYMLNPTTDRVPFEGKDFIIVSDVICTASEIDRAENLIEYNRGNILGYICLINIGYFQEPQNRFLIYLYNVLEDGNKINYEIGIENRSL